MITSLRKSELEKQCPTIFSLLSESALDKICSVDLMGLAFMHGVFGSNGFFIHVQKRDADAEYKEITQLQDKFPLEECQAFNALMVKHGYVSEKYAPEELTGQCLKPNDSKKKCRASPDKWSCIGCGKSWVPDSYKSKTCKKHPHPEWAEPLQDRITQAIQENGGPSTTAPLVWAMKETKKIFIPKK